LNRVADSDRPVRIAVAIRAANANRRFDSPPGSNRFVDPDRPVRIALPIRTARAESRCRFGPPGSNRCVDSGRPVRIALSIRAARLESLTEKLSDQFKNKHMPQKCVSEKPIIEEADLDGN